MRIAGARGHLSNADSAALAARLFAGGTRAFLLAHLSRENNLPELALGECRGALGCESVLLLAASPDEITMLPTEDLL